QRHAIIGVPTAQHRARHFARHAADRGAAPDPARWRIADPGLSVALVHVFDMHAADPVGEIMILRGRNRRRQMRETELFQPRQETLLLLATEHTEDEFGGVRGATSRHHREDQAGEEGMIEIGDAAPFQPLRLARILPRGHVRFPVFVAVPCHYGCCEAMRTANAAMPCRQSGMLTRSLVKLWSGAEFKGSMT